MAVTFDAIPTSTDSTLNAATSVQTTTLTIGSGSNRALIAYLNFSNQSVGGLAVTWDSTGASSQAMTQIITGNSTGTGERADLWGLINPNSGNKTLSAAWTGASDVVISAVSWTNVDQTGGATSFPNSKSTTANSNSPSFTVISQTSNATMACLTINAAITSWTAGTSVYVDSGPANISGAGARAAGAASVTFTATSGTSPSVLVGTDILVFTAAAATFVQNILLARYP